MRALSRRGGADPRLLALLDFEAVVDLKTCEVTHVGTTRRSREEILGALSAAPGGLLGLMRREDVQVS